jgi:diadenosine tetraphosphatase ApaH/serine/threonine PP2A family protein phosphatase
MGQTMRFAVIADIHGNADALESVLADIAGQGIAEIVNLGDHLGGPLEAGRTADILIKRDMVSIAGNHDRYLLESPERKLGSWDRAALGQLTQSHLTWISRMPATAVYRDSVFLCHGTPRSDETYLLETVGLHESTGLATQETILAAVQGVAFPVILCAHSHVARSIRLPDGRLIVNPGSVGCPAYFDPTPVPHRVESGSPDASYAIVEKTGAVWQTTFRQVPYDTRPMIDLAVSRGFPEWVMPLTEGRSDEGITNQNS